MFAKLNGLFHEFELDPSSVLRNIYKSYNICIYIGGLLGFFHMASTLVGVPLLDASFGF